MNTLGCDRPKTGDIIECSDGDIGIVLSTEFDKELDQLMIEVAWSSGQILSDPWTSEDFCTEDTLFHIMSRA